MNWRYILAIVIITVTAAILLAQHPVPDTGKADTASKPAQPKRQTEKETDKATASAPITTKEELQAKYPIDEVWIEDNGNVSIFGKIRVANATGDFETDAMAFLAEIAPLFGQRDMLSDYRVILRGSQDLVLQQYYHDVPVAQAKIYVTTVKADTIASVLGRYIRGIDVDVSPAIGIRAAEEIALTDMSVDRSVCRITGSELRIHEIDHQFHLTWPLGVLDTTELRGYWYKIDAHTGAIQSKHEMGEYIGVEPSPSDDQGQGNDR